MQLEESMLYSTSKAAGTAKEPPAKRQRRTSTPDCASAKHDVTPAITDDEDTWAALADVYQALGEQHLMHVSYASHIAR